MDTFGKNVFVFLEIRRLGYMFQREERLPPGELAIYFASKFWLLREEGMP